MDEATTKWLERYGPAIRSEADEGDLLAKDIIFWYKTCHESQDSGSLVILQNFIAKYKQRKESQDDQ